MATDTTIQPSPGIRTNSGAVQNAYTVASATASTPGVACQIIVSGSGTVTLTLQGGTTMTVNPLTGQDNIYPFAVTQWATGTATVTTFWNLF